MELKQRFDLTSIDIHETRKCVGHVQLQNVDNFHTAWLLFQVYRVHFCTLGDCGINAAISFSEF